MLEQIRRELESGRGEIREIPAVLVRSWMASHDPDVRARSHVWFFSFGARPQRSYTGAII